jgi:hypothetical protein
VGDALTKGQARFELLFAQLLQKVCWKSELLKTNTVKATPITSNTTTTNPHPIRTIGQTERFPGAGAPYGAGTGEPWTPSGRQVAPSQ